MINSIIKPGHRDYNFGKNPGKGVAQEGIWGVNVDSIGQKVEKRLGELKEFSKGVRSLDEHQGKTSNLEKTLDPLYKALDELGRDPKTHKEKISQLSDIVDDLKGHFPKDSDIKKVPFELADGIKESVSNMQTWSAEAKSDQIVNAALKQVYHNVDSALDISIPALKETNSRMANLISAKQAIKTRIENLRNKDFNIVDLVNLPLKVGTSVASKSLLAKVLSSKFGMVAGKGVGTLSAIGPVLDAIRYSKDPEGYMYQLETGEELQPIGSQERDIQLGKIL
jgi:hypothetical protein